jgi:hypothetical protein
MASENDTSPNAPRDGLIQMGAAANLAALYAADGREFVEQLAAMLESALPDAAIIERSGGLFAKKKLSKITVRLGDWTYTLDVAGSGAPTASKTKTVRGIALKTQALAVDDWLREVGDALAMLARDSREASQALRNLVEGG